MNKDIKQIQEYNRRKIICAVHGTEDYQEWKICGKCDGFGYYADHDIAAHHHPETGECLTCPVKCECETCEARGLVYTFTMLGLNKVLLAFDESIEIDRHRNRIVIDGNIYWNLTKPTIEEQDYETQLAIYKLLGGE